MLSTSALLKIHLGIATADNSEDAALDQFLAGADATLKRYIKRDIEQATYTEYLSGNGRADLILRQRPVSSITSLNVDPTGYWNQGTNPYAAATLKTPGSDYALVMDGAGVSESGMVKRLGGSFVGVSPGGMIFPSGLNQMTLSGWDRGAVWEKGDGNIKVVCVAGYTTAPSDLVMAENILAAQIRAARAQGKMLGSENYVDYAFTLLSASQIPEISELRTLLAPWVEMAT